MDVVEIITTLTGLGAKIEISDNELRLDAAIGTIKPELRLAIREHKADIIRFLTRTRLKIAPAPVKGYYCLSSAQKRLFFIHEWDKESLAYNIPMVFRLEGRTDIDRLEMSFSELIRRHEILRTSFSIFDQEPVQVISPSVDFAVERYDDGQPVEAVIRQFVRPFDLGKPPLIRVGLMELKEQEHLLMIDVHHIVNDGASLWILMKDLLSIYQGNERPEASLQYKDYAEWQQSDEWNDIIAAQRQFWLQEFAGRPSVPDMPADFPRPAIKTFEGDEVRFTIDSEETGSLKKLAAAEGTTLYMVFFALFNVLIARLTNQEDIVVGTVTSGRTHADLENLIGVFVNTIPVRNYPEGKLRFREFFLSLTSRTVACIGNQDYQYEELVEQLKLERDTSHNPLFDIVFIYNQLEATKLTLPDIQLSPFDYSLTTAKFDLTLNAVESGGRVWLGFEYSTSIFRRTSIERFVGYFREIMHAVLANADIRLADIDILPRDEKQQLVIDFNDTKTDIRLPGTIPVAFEGVVLEKGKAAAITFKGKDVSYETLHAYSDRLAAAILARGIGKEAVVGIMISRSPTLLVSLLGVLKAGCAYVPIDPEYPAARIKYIAADSGMALLLTDDETANAYFGQTPVEIVAGDGACRPAGNRPGHLAGETIVHRPIDISPTGLAYLIYTSGSTGVPKGVMIEHRNVINFIQGVTDRIPFSGDGSILCLTTVSFDIFVLETLLPLLNGWRIVLAGADEQKDPLALAQLIQSQQVDYMQITPSHLKMLLAGIAGEDTLKSLKVVMVGGEAFPGSLLKELKRRYRGRIYNMYGPTETTVWSTIQDLTLADDICIGTPIANTYIRIIDANGNLQPVNVAGELCIGGGGVARGYWKREDLTASRFIADPATGEALIYRTGDLARWLPDGKIEFLGRMDSQVKLRGFRIELGEIESWLLRYDGIEEAVVIITGQEGDQQLAAYYVAGGDIPEMELREYLAQRLPVYMLPSFYVRLTKMPLTPNGKLDRRALPAPMQNPASTEYIAPGTKEEDLLAQVWSAVLKVERIGVNDNYFSLGGDSIKSIQIRSRLQAEGYELTVKDIFVYQTIGQLASRLKVTGSLVLQSVVTGIFPLSPGQHFLLREESAGSGANSRFVILDFPEDLSRTAIVSIADKLQQHHDALRTVFVRNGDKVMQENKELPFPVFLKEYYRPDGVGDSPDGAGDSPDGAEDILAIREELQSGIDLAIGPLMRLGLIHVDGGSRLLIVLHRLVADQRSCEILLEDIGALYSQQRQGRPFTLPPKTDAYVHWSLAVSTMVANAAPGSGSKPAPGSGSMPAAAARCGASFTLSVGMTARLVDMANRPFRTETPDILLTAWMQAVKRYSGNETQYICLELPGRALRVQHIHVSRAIGQFAIPYRLRFTIGGWSHKEMIRQVKEYLRGIAAMPADQEMAEGLPSVFFHYTDSAPEGRDSSEQGLPEYGMMDCDWELLVVHRAGTLTVRLRGGAGAGEWAGARAGEGAGATAGGGEGAGAGRREADRLLGIYRECLSELIDYCCICPDRLLSPSDLTYKDISIAQLDELQTKYLLEDLYPLSPMQEGMLFDDLMNKDSDNYFAQRCFRIKGQMDEVFIQKTMDDLASRYAILRTLFLHEGLERPLQVVLRERKVEFSFEDIREAGRERSREDLLAEYEAADMRRGFDLEKDALMRLKVLHTGTDEFDMIWSFHHILMDGWCTGIIIRDFKEIYARYTTGSARLIPPARPYADYILWLQGRGKEASEQYWKEYLAGYEKPAGLPELVTGKVNYRRESRHWSMDAALVEKLKRISGGYGVTVNSIFQAAWAILLSRYNNTEEVVFGSTVSGRPAEIEGIESMVGLFINSVPVRVTCKEEDTVHDLLQKVQEMALESEPHHYHPLAEIQSCSELGRELLNHVIVFENFPFPDDEDEVGSFQVTGIRSFDQNNYELWLGVIPGEEYLVAFDYNANRFSTDTISGVIQYLKLLLAKMADGLVMRLNDVSARVLLVRDLKMLPEEERYRLLEGYNRGRLVAGERRGLMELLRCQVTRTPERCGLVCGEDRLTYGELWELSDALAEVVRRLRGDSEIVGMYMEPGAWMAAGMVGIWKAGCGFLPLEPGQGRERQERILQVSGCRLLLTERQYYGELRFEGKQWAVDGGVELPEREKMGCGEGSGELAYVIYTSGSTGEPKGVKIRRENLVNYVGWVQRSLGLTSSDRTVLTSSYAFDLGYTSLFPVLFCGGELHLLSREQYRSPSGLLGYIRDAGISYVKMTPSLFSTLVEAPGFEGYGLGALRFVVLGGERIRVGDIDRAHQAYGHIRFMNHYGPTETTIGVIAGEIEDWEGFVARPDIGRPIDGSGVYILDRSGELLPEGVVGEIGIGGAGVGGGYVGREELTRERFIPVDWLGEGRVYRTGDLGRWIKGGRIEYLGRMDQQVKIDGYRVELGEIEARLSGYVGIGSSAVVLRQRGEESYLAAYYVSQEEIEEEWLRLWLTSGLPDYMVPSVLIRLESLPLTRNGKLDVKALPEAGMTNEQSRVPPSNEIEEKLLEIWTKVLRSDKIGVTDSFFSMGGDSIKSIQITARMRAAGYQVSVNDIFRAPTIRELALKAQPLTAGPRKASHGKSVLSPIQRLFMEHPSPDKHHYNQSIMLHFPDGISAVQVKNIFDKLQEQHEALRYVFKQEQGQWMQLIPERAPAVSILEQVGGDIDSPDGWMAACNAVQQGLNLENGPLMKLGLFHNREGSDLLIVIHHLVVDGVSWRILFEDIETLYRQIKEEQPLALPQASESFFSWVSFLSTYSKSEQSTGTIEYWSRIQQTSSFTASVRDYPEGRNQYGDTAGKSFNLSKEDTTLLLTRANEAFQTEVNDILLTAFLLAINQCYHLDTVSIDLEGHGRESFSNGPDISRTVGWFTVEYPITLKIAGSDPGANLRYVKETLRQVPNKGFDYLLYAFPTDAGMSLSRPRHSSLHSLVKFNYLGQFDSDIEDKSFGIAGERSRGNDQAASTVRENDWFINGSVAGDRLTLNLSYSRRQYSGESAEALMEAYRDQLTRLIRYCASGGEKMQELHLLQTKYTLEDVYPLSPMQEGLLFHALLDPASGGYFEQKLLRVKGNLDIPAMEKSLNALISRHTILRTIFVNEGLRRPLQVVLKERKIEITYFDIREECRRRPADELVEEYRVADRSKPFDLVEDILLRLTVLRLGEDQYEMLWSSHHILMDGWCMGVLINEFGLIYRATLSGLPLLLDPPTPYSLYIRWLEKKDQEESQLYWKGYLSGYDRVAGIPRKDSVLSESLPYSSGMEPLILPKEQTKALQAISARQGVTLNTLLQCAWGLLLAKYNLQDDVVFGTVVSGRPADIEGIETMVGLFINTVPVRLKWSPGDSIAGLLRTAQEQVLQREPHQYASLPAVQAGHELGRELFDHILVFDNYPEADMVSAEDADEDFQITQVKLFEQTNYDLWLMLIPGDQFVIQFHYNRNSYDTEAIRTLSSRLAMVIRQIVEDIRMPASALTILTAEEERRIRVEWNSTEANYPGGETVMGMFGEQVERTPNNIALRFGKQVLTYRELRESAMKIAGYLRESVGIGEGDLVGVLMEREAALISSIFGILMAGAVYVPMDPHHPGVRNLTVITDSPLKAVISREKYRVKLSVNGIGRNMPAIPFIDPDEARENGENTSWQGMPAYSSGDSLAYVIYTSGSTGKPKGVMVRHHSVVNRLLWMQKTYPLNEHDVILQKTPIIFDVSVWELFWWSFTGASLCLLQPQAEKDPRLLIDAIQKDGITTLHFVPSMLSAFLSVVHAEGSGSGLRTLRQVFASGEALMPEEVQAFGRLLNVPNNTRLINLYGPTEATVDVSFYECRFNEGTSAIPIGKPIDNLRLYVLSRDGHLCPPGVAGELYIAGVGLAAGYLNNQALTEEKFLSDPFRREEKVYRTGDLAKWLPDGNIAFLGRIDQQVKIWGRRIELGEIESCLNKMPGVTGSAVIMREKEGNKYLVAYCVTEQPVEQDTIRDYLLDRLPDYMAPAYFMRVASLPLTTSGKLDRKALPDVEERARQAVRQPFDSTEEKLRRIWAEVLRTKESGIDMEDDFFRVGGHSIKAVHLINTIQREFTIRLALRDIFEYRSIARQAKLLRGKIAADSMTLQKAEKSAYYPCSSAQERLYYEYLRSGAGLAYNISGIFSVTRPVDGQIIAGALQALVDRHESLRTVFTLADNGVVQQVLPNAEVLILPVTGKHGNVKDAFRAFSKPFNLGVAPLVRVSLWEHEGRGFLFMDVHHIICDGISLNILMNDFKRLCRGDDLPPLELAYTDFAVWQKGTKADLLLQKKYWLRKLSGYNPGLDLPVLQSRDTVNIHAASVKTLEISGELYPGVKEFVARHKVSDFMMLLSLYYILLSKLSGAEDIVICTDAAGRTQAALAGVVGTFVNILPLRLKIRPKEMYGDLLENVKQCVLEAFDNQEYPFDEMISAMDGDQSAGLQPKMQVHFSLVNFFESEAEEEDPLFEPLDIEGFQTTQYEFKLEVMERQGRFQIRFIYSRELYDDISIETMMGYYENLLTGVLENASARLEQLEMEPKVLPAALLR